MRITSPLCRRDAARHRDEEFAASLHGGRRDTKLAQKDTKGTKAMPASIDLCDLLCVIDWFDLTGGRRGRREKRLVRIRLLDRSRSTG
jgi:hypothetical protein